jgi:hypothetical protein
MFKLAAIIGGVLLMAGVALAGTASSLGSTKSPTIGSIAEPVTSTARPQDRGREVEQRGRANEPGEDLRGRANEPGEDLRGAITAAPRAQRPEDNHHGREHGDRSGRWGGDDGVRTGHGQDDGGHSGHGGHGSDD